MPSGRCKSCDRLVPIVPREHKLGSRERCWYPALEHDYVGHRGCTAARPIHIEPGPEVYTDDPATWPLCEACNERVRPIDLFVAPCTHGHTKAI